MGIYSAPTLVLWAYQVLFAIDIWFHFLAEIIDVITFWIYNVTKITNEICDNSWHWLICAVWLQSVKVFSLPSAWHQAAHNAPSLQIDLQIQQQDMVVCSNIQDSKLPRDTWYKWKEKYPHHWFLQDYLQWNRQILEIFKNPAHECKSLSTPLNNPYHWCERN